MSNAGVGDRGAMRSSDAELTLGSSPCLCSERGCAVGSGQGCPLGLPPPPGWRAPDMTSAPTALSRVVEPQEVGS